MYGDLGDRSPPTPATKNEKLLDDARMLRALEQAGVRDWSGYDLAVTIKEAFKANFK